MNKQTLKNFAAAGLLSAAFLIFTALVQCVDVRPIGPNSSLVGFAAVNGWFHALTGVHWTLYTITDWLGLVSIGIAFYFGVMGLVQLIWRRSLRKVDRSILILGGFYLAVIAAYLFFETHAVNYRPVLIDNFLEASYPSSTTVLVLCVHVTAMMQLRDRMRRGTARTLVLWLLGAFTVLMVLARLISGVHWLTDIIGAVLLSAGCVAIYVYAVKRHDAKENMHGIS